MRGHNTIIESKLQMCMLIQSCLAVIWYFQYTRTCTWSLQPVLVLSCVKRKSPEQAISNLVKCVLNHSCRNILSTTLNDADYERQAISTSLTYQPSGITGSVCKCICLFSKTFAHVQWIFCVYFVYTICIVILI